MACFSCVESRSYDYIIGVLDANYNKVDDKLAAALAHQLLCIAQKSSDAEWGKDTWIQNVFTLSALDIDPDSDVDNGNWRDCILKLIEEKEYTSQSGINPDLERLREFISEDPIVVACKKLPEEIDRLPNPVDIFIGLLPFTPSSSVISNLPISSYGGLCAAYEGFAKHFAYQLAPGFMVNAHNLHNPDSDDDYKYHNDLFDQAVVPCFDDVLAAGEITFVEAELAKALVPHVAHYMRELIYAARYELDDLLDTCPPSVDPAPGTARPDAGRFRPV